MHVPHLQRVHAQVAMTLFLFTLFLIGMAIILLRMKLKPEPQPKLKAEPVSTEQAKTFIATPECRMAVHEAGHAVAAWACTYVTEMTVATIETKTGGVVEYMIHSTEKPDGMWCELVITFAGVAAEAWVHGKASSMAAESDLLKVRALAKKLADHAVSPPWTPLDGSTPSFEKLYKNPLEDAELEVLKHGYRMARHVVRSSDHRFHHMVVLLLTKKTVRESDVENVLGHRVFTKLSGLFSRPAFVVPKYRKAA